MTVEAPAVPRFYEHDVFVSYSHDDDDWVHETLLPRFKTEDISAVCDLDMPVGALVQNWIGEKIQRSRHIVCVMSPPWVSSVWTREEVSAGFGRAGHATILPVLLKPCEVPLLLSTRLYSDLTTTGSRHERELRRLIATIKGSREVGMALPLSPEPQLVEADTAVEALKELTVILKDVDVSEALKNYRTFFDRATHDIQRLADFKDVHDQLHKLQIEFQTVVLSDLAAGNRTSYRLYRSALRPVIVEIKEVQARMTTEEFRWVERLEQADALFAAAVAENDDKKAATALTLIETVLHLHTASVNSGVISSIRALRLEELLETMSAVCRDASAVAGKEFILLLEGVEALRRLARNLAALVHEHGQWQDVDSDLRLIDRVLSFPLITALAESQAPSASVAHEIARSSDMTTIGVMWPMTTEAVANLARDDENWLNMLEEQRRPVDEAVSTKNMQGLRDHYPLYRRVTVERFFKVDRTLKTQCDELRHVGAQLANVSRMLP
jgi:hypothetical protein